MSKKLTAGVIAMALMSACATHPTPTPPQENQARFVDVSSLDEAADAAAEPPADITGPPAPPPTAPAPRKAWYKRAWSAFRHEGLGPKVVHVVSLAAVVFLFQEVAFGKYGNDSYNSKQSGGGPCPPGETLLAGKADGADPSYSNSAFSCVKAQQPMQGLHHSRRGGISLHIGKSW